MDRRRLAEALGTLGLSPKKAAEFLSVDGKTVGRWLDGAVAVPGPVNRAIVAWLRFEQMGLPWRPDEIVIGLLEEDKIAKQIALMRKHVIDLDDVIQRVKDRGGPTMVWRVDLAHHEAELAGIMRIYFHALKGGLFSPSGYSRTDKEPDFQRDLPLLEDAIACITDAIEAAGPNWNDKKKRGK
jgi:hypothetical protein